MNKYTRWLDTKNRLWICVERFGKIEAERSYPEPSTVVLLNVVAETAHVFDYPVIKEQIRLGNFKQVTT